MNQSRQAIKTVYKHGAKGNTYIAVSAYAGRMRVPWDYNLNMEQNHYAAGMKFATKHGWPEYNDYVIGSLPETDSYVLVAIDKN